MKTYIYVVAYYYNKQDSIDGLISFKHTQVEASGDTDAYDKGQKKLNIKHMVNDYVAEVKKPKPVKNENS